MSSSFPSFRLTVNTKFFTFSFRTLPKSFLTQQTSNEENKKQTNQSCRCITNTFFIFITSGAKNKRNKRKLQRHHRAQPGAARPQTQQWNQNSGENSSCFNETCENRKERAELKPPEGGGLEKHRLQGLADRGHLLLLLWKHTDITESAPVFISVFNVFREQQRQELKVSLLLSLQTNVTSSSLHVRRVCEKWNINKWQQW